MPAEDNGSLTQYHKLILQLLEQHDQKLDDLRNQIADTGDKRAVILEQISSMKNDITILFGLIRDGSLGVTPVLTRIDHLETSIKSILEVEQNKVKTKNDTLNYRRALFISLLATAATIAWSIFQAVILKK
jgi:hypothetical protein